MPILTEHQDRYDAAERRFLEREYKILKERTLREHSFFSDEFKAGGMDYFIAYAQRNGHLLGQRIDLDAINWSNAINGLNIDAIHFRTLPLKRRIKKTKKWTTDAHRDNIPGFGISLNLLGWSWFFNKNPNAKELQERLDSGETIEQIFTEKPRTIGMGTAKFLCLNGETMPTSEALTKAFIFPQAYYSALKSMRKAMNRDDLPDDVRQAVFDDMRKKSALKNRSNSGLRHFGGKWWICISDDDKSVIESLLQKENISAQEWLHNIIDYS